jgi:hypothetical protein
METMSINRESDTNHPFCDDPLLSSPLIVLASDEPHLAGHLHRALRKEDWSVQLAPGYGEVESIAQTHRNAIVLLEVSRHESVEAAVELALRLKRRDSGQFVGYLADPVLHTSGLVGDAIFPRSTQHLPAALRNHFKGRTKGRT